MVKSGFFLYNSAQIGPYTNAVPSEPQAMRSGPSVEYDRGLQDPSVLYSVSVNPDGIVDLLHNFRMPDVDIAKLRVIVKRNIQTGCGRNIKNLWEKPKE